MIIRGPRITFHVIIFLHSQHNSTLAVNRHPSAHKRAAKINRHEIASNLNNIEKEKNGPYFREGNGRFY